MLAGIFKNSVYFAVLGLCCCARAFSSCGERGPLFCGARASHCAGFSRGAWALAYPGFNSCSMWAQHWWSKLSCPVAWGIFPDQGLNLCPCPGRQTVNRWTTREVQSFFRIRNFPSAPSLLRVVKWMDAEFYQVFFLHQLIWWCGFSSLVY